MANDRIVIRGAREHNLKAIDLEIPRDQLVVITGLSGSGKSSLAFDTIYAEGQRRYVESLSAYARQFLEQMEKPDVDSIEGLSPAISIEQKTTSKNPRSTVGTVTEIYDYLRVLFARVGVPHCPQCGNVISAQTVQQMVDRVHDPAGAAAASSCLAPVVRGRKGEYRKLFFDLRAPGLRAGAGQRPAPRADRGHRAGQDQEAHHRGGGGPPRDPARAWATRLADSLETALRLADGVVQVEVRGRPAPCSSRSAWPARRAASRFPEVSPRMFSFNNPYGACPDCGGIGTRYEIDPARVVPDPAKHSLSQGALAPWAGPVRGSDLQADAAGAREAPQVQPRDAVGQAPEEGARHHPLRRAGRRVRGRGEAARPPLQGDPVRGHARRGRALHDASGTAPPARARGSGRRRSRSRSRAAPSPTWCGFPSRRRASSSTRSSSPSARWPSRAGC